MARAVTYNVNIFNAKKVAEYTKGMSAEQLKQFRAFERDLKEYRKLAKRADQQMVRLERLASSGKPHFKGVLQYAYAGAQRDIRANTGASGSQLRFNKALPKNANDLRKRMADVKKFLGSSTNTKTKITTLYKKRAETTNQKYDADFSWEELARYYESEESKKLDAQYGSKTLIRALGAIKRIGNDKEQIANAIEGNIKLAKDDVVDEMARNLLKDEGVTLLKLFNN